MSGATLVRQEGEERWITLDQAELAEESAAPKPQKVEDVPHDGDAASLIYAPPKSAPILPEPGPPLALWVSSVSLVLPLLVVAAKHLILVLLHLHRLFKGEYWPQVLLAALKDSSRFFDANEAMIKVISITALFLIIVWQCCAFASLRHLYGDGLMRHGPASGLWWLVPLANMVMPILCLRELRHLSRKRRVNFHHGLPFGPLLWMLASLSAALVLWRVCSSLMHHEPELLFWKGPTTAQLCLALLHVGTVFGFATTMTCIIGGNLIQQIRLYRHWHDDAYWLSK